LKEEIMAEHECRYLGFTGGKRVCPVCLSEEPTATGEDHGNDQPTEEASTEEPSASVDSEDDFIALAEDEEPKPARRGSLIRRKDQPVVSADEGDTDHRHGEGL
jgi:hypothetical protein